MKAIYPILLLLVLCSVCAAQVDPGDAESKEAVRIFSTGKYAEALPIAKDALSKREKALGGNHILVGQAWRNLAFIEQASGNSKEAAKAFDKSLDIYSQQKSLLKKDELDLAGLLEMIAYNDVKAGQYDKAIGKYKRTIEIRERLIGGETVELALPLSNLGRIYTGMGRYEDASAALVRAFNIDSKQAVQVPNSYLLEEAAACSLRKIGKNDEADALSKRFPREPGGKPKRIFGGVINGKAIFLQRPVYPAEAKLARASGTVSVLVLIDEEGKVVSACAASGHNLLWQASESAAYSSKFSATLLEGKPVKVSGAITYKFSR